MRKRIALVAVVQLACVLVAVAPQLSARAAGDEYRLAVAPIDPIDPFRGAYVTLDYPGLRRCGRRQRAATLYVSLVRDGDLWRPGPPSRTRPDSGPYLACDDSYWQVRVRHRELVRRLRTRRRGSSASSRRAGPSRRSRSTAAATLRSSPSTEVTGRSQPPATAGITEIWVPSGVAVARLSRKRTSSLPTYTLTKRRSSPPSSRMRPLMPS